MSNQINSHLMPIRGAKGDWATKSAEEKSEAAQLRAQQIYQVDTISGLSSMVLQLSIELNAEVRRVVQMRSTGDGTSFQENV